MTGKVCFFIPGCCDLHHLCGLPPLCLHAVHAWPGPLPRPETQQISRTNERGGEFGNCTWALVWPVVSFCPVHAAGNFNPYLRYVVDWSEKALHLSNHETSIWFKEENFMVKFFQTLYRQWLPFSFIWFMGGNWWNLIVSVGC